MPKRESFLKEIDERRKERAGSRYLGTRTEYRVRATFPDFPATLRLRNESDIFPSLMTIPTDVL